MPVIRFVREQRDVECFPGENLREVALREGIELYGLKGRLGNCGGCGQCITCFVEVVEEVEGGAANALSEQTSVERLKLKRRPQAWRLACQALVQKSVMVLTRPQVGLSDREGDLARARAQPLPQGPTDWPAAPPAAGDAEVKAGEDAETDPGLENGAPTFPSATSDEGGVLPADGR
ncbi:MAG: 2Fe-2S iron-sulfur cluster-binding protein [Cyanobium sp. CZS 25K]|nr:2Fe-2S iron-sulfur cluster-binding protein [Cyanobium sp. CZS25K]